MTVGNPAVNIAIFAAFVVATLVIVLRASRNNRTAADFYDGGRAFSGPQNGIAISGDYLSAASFSASPGRSRSTATTGSYTRSASSWPGWWHCCSSRSCCATPGGSRWPTC
jgi:Na+/proline symporter